MWLLHSFALISVQELALGEYVFDSHKLIITGIDCLVKLDFSLLNYGALNMFVRHPI